MPGRHKTEKTNDTGAKLGFEQKLWAAADKLRGALGRTASQPEDLLIRRPRSCTMAWAIRLLIPALERSNPCTTS